MWNAKVAEVLVLASSRCMILDINPEEQSKTELPVSACAGGNPFLRARWVPMRGLVVCASVCQISPHPLPPVFGVVFLFASI